MNLVRIKDDLYVPEDFAKNHNYYADSEGTKKYTGITTILGVLAKPALIQWAANEAVKYILAADLEDVGADGTPEFSRSALESACEEARTAHTKKKDKAAEHGTDAHALVEKWILMCIELADGKPMIGSYHDTIAPFAKWAFENVDHFLFAERRMSDGKLFVAGTADFACVTKDGKKLMGDFKTSSGIYGIDYWLQVAAYRVLAESEGDEPYDGSVIVRLGKKGPADFEVQYRFDYETDREAFLAALTLYRAQGTYKTKH